MTTICGCVLFQICKRWNNLCFRFDKMWQVFPPWEKLRSHSKSFKTIEVRSEVWVWQRRLKWSSQWGRRKISRMWFLASQGRERRLQEGGNDLQCQILQRKCRRGLRIAHWHWGHEWTWIFGNMNEYHFLGMVERITWLKWD